MSADLVSLPGLGTLLVEEVFEYYDEPVLFVCRSEPGQQFLAVFAEDSPGLRRWLYAPLSSRRLEEVRSGGMELRNAFLLAEGGRVLEVAERSTETLCTWRNTDALLGRELPAIGERLELKTLSGTGSRPQ